MFKNWPALIISIAFFAFSAPILADGDVNDAAIQPPIKLPHALSTTTISMKKEDGILRLTPDKNELIRLNQDAASVIVNNPDHVSVLLDSPRLLIVVPHMPGSTSFTVLDSQSHTILQKEVVVTSAQPRHVRIRRMCSGSDTACQSEAHFYCPDGCYEVTPVTPGRGRGVPPPPAAAAAAATAAALSSETGAATENNPPQ